MKRSSLKVLSVILTVVMLFAAVPSVFAGATGGEGTQASPYEIATYEDFCSLNETDCSGKYFKMTANIPVPCDGFVPVGSEAKPFDGIFDGDGHSFLPADPELPYVEDVDSAYFGLFGYTDGAVLKNIVIDSLGVSGKENVGTLVGYAVNTEIADVAVLGSTSDYTSGESDNVGGIVGYIASGSVSDCVNKLEIQADGKNHGGIAGFSGADISRCINYGAVVGISNYATKQNMQYVGGIAGVCTADITSCINTGNVVGYDNVGGIVGKLGGELSFCANGGNVTAFCNCAGIFCETQSGTASYCFSAGVLSQSAAGKKAEPIAVSAPDGNVTSCVAYGGTDNNTFGSRSNVIVASKEELKDRATFTGWDFDSVWTVYPTAYSHGFEYPVLKEFNFHSMEKVGERAATCTLPGTATYTCQECRYSETVQTSDRLPHSWDDGVVVTEATCSAKGEILYSCVECDETKTEEIPIDSTAHIDGDDDNECDICHKVIKAPEKKKTVFEKIADFFRRIRQWFNDLLAKISGKIK